MDFLFRLILGAFLLLVSSVFVYGAYILYTLMLVTAIYFAIPLGIMAIVFLIVAILTGSAIVSTMVG